MRNGFLSSELRQKTLCLFMIHIFKMKSFGACRTKVLTIFCIRILKCMITNSHFSVIAAIIFRRPRMTNAVMQEAGIFCGNKLRHENLLQRCYFDISMCVITQTPVPKREICVTTTKNNLDLVEQEMKINRTNLEYSNICSPNFIAKERQCDGRQGILIRLR